uniref:Small integral membrane protein 31 n=1 Tax=Stegastes partitus TaxID=144197 RepID=A0A3B4ZJ32_9TELE
MELPFSGFELTFIIIAFVIFSLFTLASVCIQPQEDEPVHVNLKVNQLLDSNFLKKLQKKKKKNTHLICIVTLPM